MLFNTLKWNLVFHFVLITVLIAFCRVPNLPCCFLTLFFFFFCHSFIFCFIIIKNLFSFKFSMHFELFTGVGYDFFTFYIFILTSCFITLYSLLIQRWNFSCYTREIIYFIWQIWTFPFILLLSILSQYNKNKLLKIT